MAKYRCKCGHVLGLHLTLGFEIEHAASYFERLLLCKGVTDNDICRCGEYKEMDNLEHIEFEANKQNNDSEHRQTKS